MLRLPLFKFHSPRSIADAARILHGEGEGAMLLAGGTDLLPNMKRRQQTPGVLIGLRKVNELRKLHHEDSVLRMGSCVTLSELAGDPRLQKGFTALRLAASQVATPLIRNMATLGGNLCLDTRCNYYNQSYEWRKAIDFCMKKDGARCWVAPGSKRCLAVSSTDTAPVLIALGARVRMVSQSGEREIALSDLYKDNGSDYLTRRKDEIVTEVLVDSMDAWRSTYWKLRRRGSFDFPVLSVAAAVRLAHDGIVTDARIVVGSAASRPLLATDAARFLLEKPLTDDAIAGAASLASGIAKPLDNTDFEMSWRKKLAMELVTYSLRELRGDDMRATRRSLVGYDFFPMEQLGAR